MFLLLHRRNRRTHCGSRRPPLCDESGKDEREITFIIVDKDQNCGGTAQATEVIGRIENISQITGSNTGACLCKSRLTSLTPIRGILRMRLRVLPATTMEMHRSRMRWDRMARMTEYFSMPFIVIQSRTAGQARAFTDIPLSVRLCSNI